MATKPSNDRQLETAEEYDPVWEMFKNAPWDDEPLTEEDKQAIKQADENFAAGRYITHAELKKELAI